MFEILPFVKSTSDSWQGKKNRRKTLIAYFYKSGFWCILIRIFRSFIAQLKKMLREFGCSKNCNDCHN